MIFLRKDILSSVRGKHIDAPPVFRVNSHHAKICRRTLRDMSIYLAGTLHHAADRCLCNKHSSS